MIYNWEFKNTASPEKVSTIQKIMNVNPIIAQLLINFNLDTKEKIEKYLHPSLSHLHDPKKMLNMELAIERLIEALREGENILIYGDYDVDGITGVSLLYEALFKLGGKVSFYIPNRLTEGYGLTKVGIKKLLSNKPNLIIAVDCGMTAIEAVDFANSNGIDIIICDHHKTNNCLPDAYAVLNPKQAACSYPFKELAGVGVAFKLIQGLFQVLNYSKEELERYMDLVAIGTAADIVPLIDENRVFVKFGLEQINKCPRSSIFALQESSSLLGREIDVSTIIFSLAPRLNAVGRMSNAKAAVHLLTCTSLQQARHLAQVLESENKIRRNFDDATYQEALNIIENSVDLSKEKIIILTKKNWHPGVIGIIASRIMEKYNRPTILISVRNGMGKGSARSTSNFNIYDALNSVCHLLDNFGGHKFAAGFTIKEKVIEKFKNEVKGITEKFIQSEDLTPTLEVQSEISLSQLDAKLLKWLKLFAPYGTENMPPVFVSRGLEIVGNIQMIHDNHLKLKVRQDGINIDAIFYNFSKFSKRLDTSNQKIDSAYVIEENTWNSQTTIQMQIKDLNII
jgi:single-stranded-DNA-specific exonuclease